MQMNGNAELVTVAKYWRAWEDPRFVVLVLNNRDLNMVTWEMRAMAGDPKYEASQSIPDFPYAKYAQMLGLAGERVESPEVLAGAWARALGADRPYVLDVVVDPDVPPLPPHVTLKQAKAFGMSIVRGDQDGGNVIKEVIDHVFPSLAGRG
jgi:pyruvate dehydrogenase (quinone)